MSPADAQLQEVVAQEDVADDLEVVVVASRTEAPASGLPMAVSLRDVAPLDPRGPGLGLGEEVVTVPGLLVRDRFNAAQGPRISIRGFGARSAFGIRGVTVLLDGIPLTLADGLAQVDLVDPDLLGRIEVLRGPAGALYGNAAGGVLALHSAGPEEGAGEHVAVRVGGNGLRKVVVRAAEPLQRGSAVAAASFTDVAGWRDHSSSQRLVAHLASRQALSDRSELSVVASALHVPRAEDPGALTAEERDADPQQAAPDNVTFDAGERITQLQVGVRLVARPTAGEAVEASAYHVNRGYLGRVPDRVNELARDASGGTLMLRSARPVSSREHVSAAVAVEASQLTDRRLSFDSEGGVPVGAPSLHQDEEVLALGGYGQVRLELLDGRLGLLGAARYDRSAFGLRDLRLDDGDASDLRVFGAPTGMAGATVAVADGVIAYGSVADAYETPTVTELSLRPDGQAGFVDGLAAQRATHGELGVRGQRGALRGEASAFRTALRGELVPFSDPTGRTFYRNAGRSYRIGAEVAAAVALPRSIEVGAAYTWLHARFDRYRVGGVDLAGRAVPGIPPHHLGAAVDWGPELGLRGGIDVDWLGPTWADDANRARAPGQATVDLRAGLRSAWRRVTWEVRIGVENLFDADNIDNLRVNAANERYFEPGWPRFVYGGFTLGRSSDGRSGDES
jgi:iron complex outermembrane recepter protein